MLIGDFKEAKETHIPIKDTLAKIFKLLVEYCHTFKLDFKCLNDEELVELLKLAHRFQTKELFSDVKGFLIDEYELSFGNYVFWDTILDEIGETYGILKMKDKCLKAARDEVYEKTMSNDQSKKDEFYAKICGFDTKKLIALMKDTYYVIDDENFFRYLMKYNKDLLIKLIKEDAFRFSLLSQEYLLNDVKRFADSLINGDENEKKIGLKLLDKSYEAMRNILACNVETRFKYPPALVQKRALPPSLTAKRLR